MRLTFVCITAGIAAACAVVPGSLSPSAAAAAPPAARDAQHAATIAPLFGEYRGCFVLRDLTTGKTVVRYRPERCAKRLSPCSTSKVVNSLIFLETGVVSGPNHVFRWDGTERPNPEWNRDLSLKDAVRLSALWCFQAGAREVGIQRMQRFYDAMGYGNRDLSGGVDRFWLESTLKISADEQVAMLGRLQRGTLAPFSPDTQATVREMIRQEQFLPPGMKPGTIVRGKTGTAGSWKTGIDTLGWFVGTVERDGRAWAFAVNIDGNGKRGLGPGGTPLSWKARAIAYKALKAEGVL